MNFRKADTMFTGILYTTTLEYSKIFGIECYLSEYGIIASTVLLLLLSLRYMLSASNFFDDSLKNSLNIGILPLLLSFSWVVIYYIFSLL